MQAIIGTKGATDCHASDIGHWLAMTELGGCKLGRALDEATMIDPRVKGVPSTKGML